MHFSKFECKNCGHCCKKYWITLLPEEAEAQAQFKGLSLSEYLERFCTVFLQLFPFDASPNPLAISKQELHPLVKEAVLRYTDAQHFLLLPSVALKREEGVCVHYDGADKKCSIHAARPKQCELFPLIGRNENAKLVELYSFCKGLKAKEYSPDVENSKKQLSDVQHYFDQVKEKGFRGVWKALPSNGVWLYKDEKLFETRPRLV